MIMLQNQFSIGIYDMYRETSDRKIIGGTIVPII